MKLIFAESKSDAKNYNYPYEIGAIAEKDEKPSAIINRGFLMSPSSRKAARYTLVRSIRIRLADFRITSKNRRVLRKGEGIAFTLIPRDKFTYSKKWQTFCRQFADVRFGQGVMSEERLERIFTSEFLTHIMVFTDTAANQEVGLLLFYVEAGSVAYCLLPFYDLSYLERHLGMYQATSAVRYFAEQGFTYFYFGSGYGSKALYKTQFRGVEFFTGITWSPNLEELKQLIRWDEDTSGAPYPLGDNFQPADDEDTLLSVTV